jgi:hypothetical protein
VADQVVSVQALLREPSSLEVREGLERNPGSRRLADRGWRPLWFEAHVVVEGDHDAEHHHSLIWAQPDRDVREVAQEELSHALDEALRNLRDMEGLDVWPEDVVDRDLKVEADVA